MGWLCGVGRVIGREVIKGVKGVRGVKGGPTVFLWVGCAEWGRLSGGR